MGAGRESTLDTSRLRGEPRGARRPADRRLPPPRARPANAVADLRASTREARRRRARRAHRCLQRQSRAARRGPRARPDLGRAGRAQHPRRHCCSRRDRRALCGCRDRTDRAYAAGRSAPRRPTRTRGATRRDRARAWRLPRRARARLAPRSRAEHRRDTRGSTTGDGSLVRSRRVHAPRRERTRTARSRSPPAPAPPRRQG